jgi:hypothetical protein
MENGRNTLQASSKETQHDITESPRDRKGNYTQVLLLQTYSCPFSIMPAGECSFFYRPIQTAQHSFNRGNDNIGVDACAPEPSPILIFNFDIGDSFCAGSGV